MNKRFFWMAFAIGLAAILWVGWGFVGNNPVALAMTAVIAFTFLLGTMELHQHRADSAALFAALPDPSAPASAPITALGDWLARVPPALRGAVRQRIEAGRGALPGPALTPYLVGLLVMLGMLGTFLGMVVTFRGAVFALEGSTDLQAIRAALAEPIRGLGLSFGTSIAGVAASAMLGLMSAISRRERLDVARALDGHTSTTLRPFSLAHQREESLRATQAQAAVLPAVVEQLEALMSRIEQRSQQLDERLLASHARFQQDAAGAYTTLAREVGTALQDSLAAGARAAGDSIRPVMESAMAQIAQGQARHEAERVQAWSHQLQAMADERAAHGQRMEQLASQWATQLQTLRADEQQRGGAAVQRLDELQAAVAQHLATLGAALEAPLARLLATASEVPQAAAGVLVQLRQEMAHLSQQENAALQERTALVERLGGLMLTVQEAAQQATQMASQMAQHATANAVELSSWGDAFGQSVQLFHTGNEKLASALAQVESAITRSTTRSDEQLAYYVAQAREVIDLSIASQHGVLERLRTLGQQPALAEAEA